MKIRTLNLASGAVKTADADDVLIRQYIGGLGLSVRLMSDKDLNQPPLSPGLPLIIAVGCLTDTGFPGANRASFYSVSPLTGLTAGSWMGGNFGVGLARTGNIALVLEGNADEPSILFVDEDNIKIVPRPDLWGLKVSEARNLLLQDYPNSRNVVIGPAGESLVPMACIRGDESHSAGRCGMGAVLGSKNIKGIVVSGKARPVIADPEGFKSISNEAKKSVRESPFLKDIQGPIGTCNLVEPVNSFHAFPTGNHRERYFATADKIYGERIARDYVVRRTTCPHCAVRCRLHVKFDEIEYDAPEYESVWSLGGDNLVDDYSLIVKANALCNELGLDTMSAGVAVAFYREYTNTLDDPSNMLDLISKIGYREGVGNTLSQGTRFAAKEFGVDYAMQVKGLELAAYDPRKFIGMAISYSTANRGGCHSRAWTVGDELTGHDFTASELAQMVARYHNAGCLRDSLIMCTFLDGTVRPLYSQALTALLGHSYDDDELAKIGERIYTLERLLNVRLGLTGAYDTLPKRLVEGLVDPDKYRDGMAAYYKIRDWNAQGKPSEVKLKELDLSFAL